MTGFAPRARSAAVRQNARPSGRGGFTIKKRFNDRSKEFMSGQQPLNTLLVAMSAVYGIGMAGVLVAVRTDL